MASRLEKVNNIQLLAFLELSPILIPYFLGFFVFRGFYAIFPLFLQIKNDYTDTEIVAIWALVSGLALFIGGLTRIPAGLISDKIGRKNAIFLAYIIYLIALVLLLMVDGIVSAIIAITLVRTGLNLYAMTGRGIVSGSHREKGFKNGLLSAMVGTGSLLGPIIFSFSLENFRPDFMLYIALTFIIIDSILFLVALKIVPKFFAKITDEEMEFDLKPIVKKRAKLFVPGFRVKGVMLSITYFFLAGIIYGLITTVYSIFGYNIMNISIFNIGLIVGIGAAIQIIWAPITGIFYMRFIDENVRILAWIGLTLASLLVFLGQFSLVLFIIGYMLLTLSNASYFTMEITRLGRLVDPKEFAIIFGTATSLSIIGSSFASYASNELYSLNPAYTFLLSTLMAFTGLLYLLIVRIKAKN